MLGAARNPLHGAPTLLLHALIDLPSADAISTASTAVRNLRALRPGAAATVIGLSGEALLAAAARATPDERRLLLVDPGDGGGAEAVIARILEDLAELALAAWPDWPAPADPSRVPASWRRAADRLAEAGRRPLFRSVVGEIQFRALHAAAGAPVLAVPIDPVRPGRAAPLIAAAEWCRRHGAATAALLPETPAPEPPWDRILHGALLVAPSPPVSALSRLAPQPTAGPRGSTVERRMRVALAADPDLVGLFADEVTLRLGPAFTPRVDLLWAEGKVVVELDGAEHERDPAYGADRHRDYELLVAGYLVLRLTNAEVELDLARALDKVRRVVNLRRQAP